MKSTNPCDRLLRAGWAVTLLGAGIAAGPYLIFRLMTDSDWSAGLRQRLGWWPPEIGGDLVPGQWFWIHASSVGEVKLALRLASVLEGKWPGTRSVISVFTPRGYRTAQGEWDRVVFLPFDLPGVTDRLADHYPKAFLSVETEIWPNLLLAFKARRVPAFIVNGRLSEKSTRRYRLFKPFVARVMKSLWGIMAQSPKAAERFAALGYAPKSIMVTGNLKYDSLPSPIVNPPISFPDRSRVIIAASLHPGEEAPFIDLWENGHRLFPDLTLILAPRHLHWLDSLTKTLRSRSIPVIFHSRPEGETAAGAVYLVDTHGDLAGLFHLGGVVFVGGTLIPVGGHNLMEPATAGRGVIFGPNVRNVSDMAEDLLDEGGGIRVDSSERLTAVLSNLLEHPSRMEELSAGALRAVSRGKGALDRTIEGLRKWLGDGE